MQRVGDVTLTVLSRDNLHVAGAEVAASDNVVLENLHSTRNLETTYYVTDMTQASDFYWDRESGLRVNIGILNVHLIPEFEDVDHGGGDNNYMLKNPNNSEDKSKYLAVLRQFCRCPRPLMSSQFSFCRYLLSMMYVIMQLFVKGGQLS